MYNNLSDVAEKYSAFLQKPISNSFSFSFFFLLAVHKSNITRGECVQKNKSNLEPACV